jgi:mannose-6-phosphate isomerase-like protein (cupin superfamily)
MEVGVQVFDIAEIARRREEGGRPYLEFLRASDLSVGLYVLPAGGEDRQSAHTEDEVYYVVAGRARVRVGNEVGDVAAGSVVFVAAHVPHRFEDISEALSLLVVFGPAERSRSTTPESA